MEATPVAKSPSLPLGILDLSKLSGSTAGHALEGTVALAQDAETNGYRRFWIAEHHVQDSSHSCPEILAAVIAAQTSSIHVGAGGILLRYYSPLKVAETFLALEALFPGRIDLGVARGPGVVAPAVAEALVYGNVWELGGDAFDRKVFDLTQLLALAHGDGDAVDTVLPRPAGVNPPPTWLLGSGPSSASLAARLRLPYAVAAFTATPDEAARQVASYRDAVAPSAHPTALAVSVTVAHSTAAASARDAVLTDAGYLPANVSGDPATVVRWLREIRARSGVDEIILTTFTTDVSERRDAFASITQAYADN